MTQDQIITYAKTVMEVYGYVPAIGAYVYLDKAALILLVLQNAPDKMYDAEIFGDNVILKIGNGTGSSQKFLSTKQH